MKLKIKVKVLTEGCMPEINEKGDWIDLKAAKDMEFNAAQSGTLKKKTVEYVEVGYRNVEMNTSYIPLGVAMKLPNGFEAIVASRSSGPKKLNIFIPNGIGIIDQVYSGNGDEWNYVASSMKATTIHKGDRICQFRIQLSQKATMWQKLKWLFSSGIELVEVDDLGDNNRGGFGSTGVK